MESQALRFVPSLNLLWCAQALASASCTRSSARSELQVIDLANARGRVSSASNPVRNGSQFWRGTLQRCGSEFDNNSNKRPPVRGVHRGHRGNRRYFRASRPGATRRTASYLQISPSRGSAVCLYRYGLRHSLTNDWVHYLVAATRRSGSPASRENGTPKAELRVRQEPDFVLP